VRLSWRGANILFLICSAVQSAAEGHVNAFTPLLLQELGLGPAEIAVWTGLLMGLMMAAALPLAPFWGVLAERYSGRPVILRGFVLLAGALLLAAWADDVRWLVVTRLLMGLCFGTGGLIMATQAMITPGNRLGSAVATIQAAQPIAASLGPPLGALAIPHIGLRGLFVVDAALVLVAALALGLLMPEPAGRVKRGSVLGRTGEVLGLVWTIRPIRWNFFSSFLMRGATSVVDAYLPVRITQLSPDPAAAIGVILGAYGACTTFSVWLVGRLVDRTDETLLYWRAMLFGTLVTLGMALTPSILLLAVLAVLRSIPVACGNTVLYAHAARVLPREQQTTIFSLSPIPRNAGQLVFPLLAAAIAGLAPGAALGLGALGYGFTFLAARRLAALTRARGPTVEPHGEPA
jgi:DHA1 family multidrug resistance protein-like MFS transporter